MLHAFSAKTSTSADACTTAGQEIWAYVPRSVMPYMYRLADTNYEYSHRFFVNGSPIIGDVSKTTVSGATTTITWKTILVGGLGAGGKGYYALDISNPNSPVALWEFDSTTDSNLGLTYSPPVITKIPDSSGNLIWVVAFTSGLNNNGNGYLYILDANSGALLYKVPTNYANGTAAGASGAPSGLGRLNAWVDTETNNTALRFYAGDQLGNLWRFDVSNLTPPTSGNDTRATQLAQFKIGTTPQPINIRPELAKISYGGNIHAVVLVGTGRYLGKLDLEDVSQQTVYAIRDPLTTTGWGNVRTNSGLVTQTFTTVGNIRTVSHNGVDWNAATTVGWKVDFLESGERVITNMSLQYNTLTLASAIPKNTSCNGSGTSWIYNLNIYDGSYTTDNQTSEEGGHKLGDYLALGLSAVAPQGEKKTGVLITHSDGGVEYQDGVGQPTGGVMRRTSWREIAE
jgi:type IV pilus assembly protein PilY1